MKNYKDYFLSFKATLFISMLTVLGFTSCDGGDIQPEYGVPVVREKQIKSIQKENDLVVQKEYDSKDLKTNE